MMAGCHIESAPHRLEYEHSLLFTSESRQFVTDLVVKFEDQVRDLLVSRQRRLVEISQGQWKVEFVNENATDPTWKIGPLPERLLNRKLDLGDVSPADSVHLRDALYARVEGIQVDFDDGHCPTWRNTVQGLYNVTAAVHSTLTGGPVDLCKAPLLMMRPRAFNMTEHNCMINGKKVPAPLFDFALIMFHNAKRMFDLSCGPYFYLSKIEHPLESALWNDIFVWSQDRLKLPYGTIKACVLIENILAAYRMEDILHAFRDHAIGLNCGVWDYSASIVAKFGDNASLVLPDRQKYVNMSQPFLRDFLHILVATCHRRGALATGGMAAQLLSGGSDGASKVIEAVKIGKKKEIESGVDGFMVYDLRLVDDMMEMWEECLGDRPNQIDVLPDISHIKPGDLLKIPEGGVTIQGLRKNAAVALLFIYHWLSGSGVFFYDGAVEDSATAEISRSQLWQWIRFATPIESTDSELAKSPVVTYRLVYHTLDDVINGLKRNLTRNPADRKRLLSAKYILLEIVTSRDYIEFLTTHLNDSHKFRSLHNKNEGLEAKL